MNLPLYQEAFFIELTFTSRYIYVTKTKTDAMKPTKTIIFIYHDLSFMELYMLNGETHEYKIQHFSYPEDFEAWAKKNHSDMKDIELIVLGHYFPRDGGKHILTGFFRGLLFYIDLLENPLFKNVPIFIPCTMLEEKFQYEKKLKELHIVLREMDCFCNMPSFTEIYEKFLKRG